MIELITSLAKTFLPMLVKSWAARRSLQYKEIDDQLELTREKYVQWYLDPSDALWLAAENQWYKFSSTLGKYRIDHTVTKELHAMLLVGKQSNDTVVLKVRAACWFTHISVFRQQLYKDPNSIYTNKNTFIQIP
jgi:hypothetical protein